MRRGAQEKRRGTYTSPVSDRDGRPGRDLRAGEISGTAALLDTHAILESIPEPVGLVDRQGRILAFNAAGRHVIFAARTQEVALGDDLFSFISPHNVAGVRESLDRAFSGEAHTHKTEAGGRHFETVYSPVRGPGGDVAAVSIRVADVTRRENAIAELAALNATLEQRVAERGEELRVILSATHDGFALFRPGAWFEDVNEAYCRLVGYSRDELLRMNLRDVEAGLSPERFEELSRRLREEGSVSFESRHRRKDGGVVDIDATVNWENVVGGRFFAFVRDISARKEAEAVRDRQLEILEATPEFVGMADEERRLLYLNPAGRRLVGLDCAFSGDQILAVAVVWDTELRTVVEMRAARMSVTFPYVPGLLSFLVAHVFYVLAYASDTRALVPLRALPAYAFGLVMIEALACGVPVAAYPVTGPKDVIGDSGVGALDTDLKAATRKAIGIPSDKCIEFAKQFSWEQSARGFLSNLRQI